MTVYPFIIHLGPIEVTGYGLMLMVAFLMGGWLIARQLRQSELREEYAADMVAAAVIGGIIGAKLWYVALTGDPDALLSRGGLVWYGGFIGGAAGSGPEQLAPEGSSPVDHAARRSRSGGCLCAGTGRLLSGERRLRPSHRSPLGSQISQRASALDRREP